MTSENPPSQDPPYLDAQEKSFFKKEIHHLFNRISSSYDLMNDIMSGGLHRVWKDIFVKRVAPQAGEIFLDLAGGTGDITQRLLKKTQQNSDLFVADLNFKMIYLGRSRLIDQGLIKNIYWTVACAEDLPFPNDSFDKITISFGLRNVSDRRKSLEEIYRVLKPNGTFFCLEFSHPSFPILRKAYQCYSTFIPLMGDFIAQDRAAYQYLVDSIQRFPLQEALQKEFEEMGFLSCSFENLTGGIVAIHQGTKEYFS